jgi:AcrR family transcriptional regulator
MESERKKLLDAAVIEFSKSGIKGSSLKAISERAGLEEGAARAIFIDKMRLYRELLKEISEPLISVSGFVSPDDNDPREFLMNALKLYDDWLLSNPRFVRLIAWGIAEEISFFDSVFNHVFYPSDFFEKMEKFISDGSIRIKDINSVFLIIESMIVFGHLMKPNIKMMYPDKTDQEIFELRFNAMFDVLSNGLFRPAE